MTFKLKIECNTAAFDRPDLEIARILRRLADAVESGTDYPHTLRDLNGNRVGIATLA